MHLEDLYNNDIGHCALFLQNKDEKHIIPLSFHDYCNIAYKFLSSDIKEFENIESTNLLGIHSSESCNFLFLAIESYINTILKVICLEKKDDFSLIIKKSLNHRIAYINNSIGLDHSEFCKNFQQARLNEYEEFRNEMFHDRILESEKKFKKTFFSPTPNIPCISSELQALIIALDLFEYYRNIFPGVDLMPSICIFVNNTFFFEKFDIIYNVLLKPTIDASLVKHNLQTHMNLKMQNSRCPYEYVPNKYKLIPLIKAESNAVNFTREQTNFFMNSVSEFIKGRTINENTFGIPSYIRLV